MMGRERYKSTLVSGQPKGCPVPCHSQPLQADAHGHPLVWQKHQWIPRLVTSSRQECLPDSNPKTSLWLALFAYTDICLLPAGGQKAAPATVSEAPSS